jgi:hypothetical protein
MDFVEIKLNKIVKCRVWMEMKLRFMIHGSSDMSTLSENIHMTTKHLEPTNSLAIYSTPVVLAELHEC